MTFIFIHFAFFAAAKCAPHGTQLNRSLSSVNTHPISVCVCVQFMAYWFEVTGRKQKFQLFFCLILSTKLKGQWYVPDPLVHSLNDEIDERRLPSVANYFHDLWWLFHRNILWISKSRHKDRKNRKIERGVPRDRGKPMAKLTTLNSINFRFTVILKNWSFFKYYLCTCL